MYQKNNIQITLSGSYLPKRIITNFELAEKIDTSDEWISTRTGISQRHIAEQNELASDMAYNTISEAISKNNYDINTLDAIICTTNSPDLTYPSTATIIAQKLKLKSTIPCFDIQAVCSGFVYGFDIAYSMLLSKRYKKILIVCTEKNSVLLDWQDRSTCVLFGDGAGFVILESTEEDNHKSCIIDSKISSDSQHLDLLKTTGGVGLNQIAGNINMNGKGLFKVVVQTLPQEILEILNKNSIKIEDVKYIIPHQANSRILDYISEQLQFDKSKFVITIDKHANTSSASIPLALDQLIKNKKIERGDILLFVAFGAGFTWGMNLIKY